MPIPCTSFNPLSPGPAVGMPSLQAPDPSLTAGVGSAPKDSSASFDRFLSDEDKPSASPDESAQPPPTLAPSTVTPEQLAMMASMVMPNPALLPPPQVQPDSTDAPSSFQLSGAEGRSVPELLARGSTTLDYQMASASGGAAAPAPAATAVVPAGKSTGASPAATQPDPVDRGLSAPLLPAPQAPADLSSPEPLSPNPSSALLSPSTPSKVDGTAVSANPAPSVFKVNRLWKEQPFRLRETASVTLPAKDAPPSSPLASSAGASAPDGSVSPGAAFTSAPPSSPAPTADPSASTESQSDQVDGSETPNTAAAPPAIPAPLAKGVTEGAAANSPKPKGLPSERREKSAGLVGAIRSAGGKPSSVRGKNVALPVDSEGLENPGGELGTVAANWGKLMNPETRNLPVVARQSDPASFASLVRNDAGTTASDVKTIAPSHATDLVHEIKDIADGLWSVERNSVEVKFNFSAQERLSVKVEYRDGTVQATFRSDSADVRDAIAREWQAQASAPTEQRPYRVADPIFTGSSSTPGSSLGGDASRQQRSPEQPQTTAFDRLPLGGNLRSASPNTSSIAPSFLHRETPGHLHAFV